MKAAKAAVKHDPKNPNWCSWLPVQQFALFKIQKYCRTTKSCNFGGADSRPISGSIEFECLFSFPNFASEVVGSGGIYWNLARIYLSQDFRKSLWKF